MASSDSLREGLLCLLDQSARWVKKEVVFLMRVVILVRLLLRMAGKFYQIVVFLTQLIQLQWMGQNQIYQSFYDILWRNSLFMVALVQVNFLKISHRNITLNTSIIFPIVFIHRFFTFNLSHRFSQSCTRKQFMNSGSSPMLPLLSTFWSSVYSITQEMQVVIRRINSSKNYSGFIMVFNSEIRMRRPFPIVTWYILSYSMNFSYSVSFGSVNRIIRLQTGYFSQISLRFSWGGVHSAALRSNCSRGFAESQLNCSNSLNWCCLGRPLLDFSGNLTGPGDCIQTNFTIPLCTPLMCVYSELYTLYFLPHPHSQIFYFFIIFLLFHSLLSDSFIQTQIIYYRSINNNSVMIVGSFDKTDEEEKKEGWVPTKLNWTVILYDENIFIDAQLYRKWDRNLSFEGEELLEKDLIRTRSNEPYFKKDSTKQLLKRITTFYCIQNRVNYQQGLLEVVIPFALLKRKDFQTRKCYAYFNSFMKKYFPRVLTQKTIQNRKELPHAILGITLTQILLKYHEPSIYQTFKNHQIPLSMIVTQQILTIFAKNVPIPFVYQIFNFFMNKRNKNYLLYMCVALISGRKQQIFLHSQDDQLHTFVNKSMKEFKTKQDLQAFFQKCIQIQEKTPKSFQILSKRVGFCQRSFFTYQDYQRMMKLQEMLIDFIMPVYRQQIDKDPKKFMFILLSGQVPSKKYEYVRLSVTEQGGTIIYNQKFLNSISKEKILVVGYTQFRQKQQKSKLLKLIKEINMQTNYSYKFMMFEEKLQAIKQCTIY